jgi:hypothetical protein
MKHQTGSASLFLTCQKGTITVLHGTSGDVLLQKVNAPEGSWESLCEYLQSLCSDSPPVEKSRKKEKLGKTETLKSESKVKGFFRKINIYPKRDFHSVTEEKGVFTVVLKKSSDKFKTDEKLLGAGFTLENKAFKHPVLNLLITKTLN